MAYRGVAPAGLLEPFESHAIDSHRLRDVLEPLLAHVLEGKIELACTSSCTRPETQIPPGSASASSRAATFTPSPQISPPSTMMSPTLMPIRNSIRRSCGTSALRPQCALDLDGTAYRSYRARELHQQPITGDPDNSASVLRYLGRDKFAPMCLPLGERAFLVSTDKPTVASYIGRGTAMSRRSTRSLVTSTP